LAYLIDLRAAANPSFALAHRAAASTFEPTNVQTTHASRVVVVVVVVANNIITIIIMRDLYGPVSSFHLVMKSRAVTSEKAEQTRDKDEKER
jgi:hypothetical protein